MKICPSCGDEMEPELYGPNETGRYFCTNPDCDHCIDSVHES